MKVFFY